MRPQLSEPELSETAVAFRERWHRSTVDEVRDAIAANDVVVVGMAWNPHIRRARRALDAAGVEYAYLGYGNYLSGWRKRLAIKLWSGWPTFPQVYVRGELIGGADETKAALADGSLQARLS